MINSALKKWQNLSRTEKQAHIPEHGKMDTKYHRARPNGAVIIKTVTRALEHNNVGHSHITQNIPGKLAAIDHLWLRTQELQKIHQIISQGGGPLPPQITYRIARYHLTDNTRGEPPFWKKDEIRNIHIHINQIGKLTGAFELNTQDAKRGYTGTLEGTVKFNGKQLSNLQILALGKHWGEGRYTRGARPGKKPLGIYFELVQNPQPADTIPPQGIHWEPGYWNPSQ